MIRIAEPISNRVYYLPEDGGYPLDLCAEGYRLENGVEVVYIGGKWEDYKSNEYIPVEQEGEFIGFNMV